MSRWPVVAVAVLVLAWLGVMERDARLEARGARALRPGAAPARLDAAAEDLRRARWLNPDPQPAVDLALLARARGKTGRAIAAMEAVVRDEPDNLVAWGVLAVLARGTDPGAAARARAAALRLDPLNFR